MREVYLSDMEEGKSTCKCKNFTKFWLSSEQILFACDSSSHYNNHQRTVSQAAIFFKIIK